MGRLFGTDGVRGVANRDLTAELALDLAVAAAHVLANAGEFEGQRPLAVVGRDPRLSGEFLEAAVVAGLASAGVDVLRLRVLPTPAVAYLAAHHDVDLGVMISASHNPMPDNGIKFFARGGHKLEDVIEDAIERRLREPWPRPVGDGVGRIGDTNHGAADTYVRHLLSTTPQRLDGLKIVLDCAQGAASEVAPAAFRAAGADVVAIHAEPDGLSINDGCGSTHPDSLRAAVVAHGADAGFAFDGDADRVLAADAAGELVDGDQILAILALAMKDAGTLKDDVVVATVMSNLGFLHAMRAAGIVVRQTAVGDRYLLESMRAEGFVLGGEQSGHLIMTAHATTGDGTLAALQVAARMAGTGSSLADLAGIVVKLPQVLVNVPNVDRSRAGTDQRLAAAVRAAEADLGDGGRVLLRPSGTEPVVRVMVEAQTLERARQIATRLSAVVEDTLAL
ncbi:MAG: phosphoglucosamine mutase [Nocardioidaceae bacterium]